MTVRAIVRRVGQRSPGSSAWVAWTTDRVLASQSRPFGADHHSLMLYGAPRLLRLSPKWTGASGEPLALSEGALWDEAMAVSGNGVDE